MTLITILAALALERFLHFGHSLFRFTWFESYLGLMRKVFAKTGLWKGLPGLILILLPILAAVAILYCFLGWMLYGLVGLILAIIILTYTLGPRDFYQDLENYFAAVKGKDDEAVKKSLACLLNPMPSDTEVSNESAVSRSVTKAVLTQFNQRIFAVLFWFVVLGPFGAVLYRVVAKVTASAEKSGSPDASMLLWTTYCLDALDWIPIRLAGLSYSLVGDFHHGFTYWIKNVISGFDKNREFTEQSGLIALHLTEQNTDQSNPEENQSALALTDRTLILYLVVIALFVLGALIY